MAKSKRKKRGRSNAFLVEIGCAFERARLRRVLSVEQIARRARLSAGRLRRLEQGMADAPLRDWVRLARVLRMQLSLVLKSAEALDKENATKGTKEAVCVIGTSPA